LKEAEVAWDLEKYVGESLQAPRMIQVLAPNAKHIFLSEGGNNLNDRSINGSFNQSKLENGIAIQSDNTVQCFGGKQEEFERIFSELRTEIEQIEDRGSREQAEYLAEDLKESYKNNDKKKTERVFGLLTSILGVAGSMASLASLFGIVIKV